MYVAATYLVDIWSAAEAFQNDHHQQQRASTCPTPGMLLAIANALAIKNHCTPHSPAWDIYGAAAACCCWRRYEGPKSTNPLSFRYYNAEEKVLGKTMKDWCVAGGGGKESQYTA
jgi:hypothetical protein